MNYIESLFGDGRSRIEFGQRTPSSNPLESPQPPSMNRPHWTVKDKDGFTHWTLGSARIASTLCTIMNATALVKRSGDAFTVEWANAGDQITYPPNSIEGGTTINHSSSRHDR